MFGHSAITHAALCIVRSTKRGRISSSDCSEMLPRVDTVRAAPGKRPTISMGAVQSATSSKTTPTGRCASSVATGVFRPAREPRPPTRAGARWPPSGAGRGVNTIAAISANRASVNAEHYLGEADRRTLHEHRPWIAAQRGDLSSANISATCFAPGIAAAGQTAGRVPPEARGLPRRRPVRLAGAGLL